MKRILIIPSWYPTQQKPSLGIFFRLQARLLVEEGYDVKVLLPVVEKQSKKEFIANKGKRSVSIQKEWCIQDPEALYIGFKVQAFSKKLLLTKEVVAGLVPDLNAMLEEWNWKPDIIHAHDCIPAGFFAEALSRLLKCPWVLTQHTPLVVSRLDAATLESYRFLTAQATCFSVVSRYERDLYIRNQFIPDAFVLGNLLNENSFYPADSGSGNSGLFTIVNVGSLSARKDYVTLLQALKLFKEKYSRSFQVKLVLLTGFTDGITLEEIQNMAAVYQLTESIEYLFNISEEDVMRKFYQESSVMISTSLYETFGVAVAEAIGCGIPVIAADNGGVRDIIEEGENGFIVPLKDAEAIALRLEELFLRSTGLNRKQLHQSVVDKFGQKKFAEKLTALYEKAANLYNYK